MGDTKTSNRKLGIATTTTDHLARTLSASDVCFDPAKKVTAPFPNQVPTARATEHSSQKTQITEGLVVRVGDAIGAPSDAAHGFSGGGIVSGTYRLEARCTQGSQDVFVEKKPVARATDPTTQNHANTTGAITEPTADGLLAALNARKLARCTLQSLKAVCSDNGREAQRGLLEVVYGDSVKLTATRVNATEPGTAAVCPPPPGSHLKTKYVLVRTGKLGEKRDTKIGNDELTLTAAEWIGTATKPVDPHDTKVNKNEDKFSTDKKKYERTDGKGEVKTTKVGDGQTGDGKGWLPGRKDDKGNAWKPELTTGWKEKGLPPPTTATGDKLPTNNESKTQSSIDRQNYRNGATMTDGQKAQIAEARATDARNKELMAMRKDATAAFDKSAAANKAQEDKEAATKARTGAIERAALRTYASLDGLKAAFNGGDATTIQVAAFGCVGAQTLTLRTYPETEYAIDLMAVGEIVAAFTTLRSAVSIFENFCNLAGKDTLTVSLFGKPIAMLKWQFVELTHDSSKEPKRTKNMVFAKWELELGFDPLLSATANFAMPIYDFAGPAGRLAGWVLKKVANAEIGVEIGISVGLSVKGKMDEYLEQWSVSPKFSVKASVKVYVKVQIGVKRERDGTTHSGPGAEITLSSSVTFPLVFDSFSVDKQGLKFKLAKPVAGKGVVWSWEAAVKVDVWGLWETEKSLSGIFGEYIYDEKWFGPWPG